MAEYKYGTYGEIGDSIITSGESVDTVALYVGTAPINLVRGYADKALVNTPVEISSLSDAQRKLGYCEDWGSYTLCEAMAAHFDNPNGSVGPAYFVNVLDPKTHKGEEGQQKTLTLVNGKAELPGTKTILDSIKIPRPVPEGTHQATAFRGNGETEADTSFDYAKAYKDAGVTLEDGVLTYAPTGKIDSKIVRDGFVSVGVAFTKPDSATNVKVTCDGEVAHADIDLSQTNDQDENVVGNQFVAYFDIAREDGTPLKDFHRNYQFDWTGSETPTTVCMVSSGDGRYFAEDDDYTLTYNFDRGAAVISNPDEILPDTITIEYGTVDDTKVEPDDIVGKKTAHGEYFGIAAVDLLFNTYGKVPNLLAAPGWSHLPEVYKALCKAARKANGHWDSFVIADMPLVDGEMEPVDTITKAIKWKSENHYDDERSKVYWPMAVDSQGRLIHLSALATAEQVRTDQTHDGIPCETNGNKPVSVQRQYFGEETKNRGFDQFDGNELAKNGISTVVPWGGKWNLWGDHTAAYAFEREDLDARAIFDVTLRMLMYITNSFQLEWADDIDEPMTRAKKDSILNREQEKLDNLVSLGALLGSPTVEFSPEVTESDVLMGNFVWNIQATPVVPLKSATAIVAYTDTGLSVLLEGE